ncbi:threonine aldolase family protein [Kribbella antibiotica]|uniref:threonine aldolase family protein n=1 Tax=Kribbella antibiotica TaxID=190195 RepID=UPI001EDD4AAA|nr:beta-eliminating lyase-related protein [Kribbella antibiotica]
MATSAEDLRARRQTADKNCDRWFSHAWVPAPERLRRLAESATEEQSDSYGHGGDIEALEREVAELLGKPAAVFMPSGIMAQQSVLRVYADRAGTKRVAVHGQSHLLVHELNTLEEVHQLRIERLTSDSRQPRPDELAAIPGNLAAVTLELPLREPGFLLPTWDELVVFAQACADRGVPLHLDGARLWESTPYLKHSLAEISALATSVYLSFYKGLGGLAGAVLAGPEDVIAESRRWQRRLGGNLFTMLPYAVAAREGLRTALPLMGDLHQRAVEVAMALQNEGYRVVPDPPHTNSFQVHAPRDAEAMDTAAVDRMERTRESICWSWRPSAVPGWSWTELVITPHSLQWPVSEIAKAYGELLRT